MSTYKDSTLENIKFCLEQEFGIEATISDEDAIYYWENVYQDIMATMPDVCEVYGLPFTKPRRRKVESKKPKGDPLAAIADTLNCEI